MYLIFLLLYIWFLFVIFVNMPYFLFFIYLFFPNRNKELIMIINNIPDFNDYNTREMRMTG